MVEAGGVEPIDSVGTLRNNSQRPAFIALPLLTPCTVAKVCEAPKSPIVTKTPCPSVLGSKAGDDSPRALTPRAAWPVAGVPRADGWEGSGPAPRRERRSPARGGRRLSESAGENHRTGVGGKRSPRFFLSNPGVSTHAHRRPSDHVHILAGSVSGPHSLAMGVFTTPSNKSLTSCKTSNEVSW